MSPRLKGDPTPAGEFLGWLAAEDKGAAAPHRDD
jgi:hypothetical protein